MQNPLIIGCIVFLILLAGAFAGWMTRQRLPAHQLTDDTKNLVSVSMAVVGTVSALVLGLLISNANSSFSALGGEVTALSAQILRLDQMLQRYGPDTTPARETLRQYAEHKTAEMFPDDPADFRLGDPATYGLLQQVEDSMLALKPANQRDKWWLDQAMTLAAKIGDTRMAINPAAWPRNSKTVPCSPRLLADITVCQFRSVRAAQLHIRSDSYALRTSSSWRRWNDPGIGERVWRSGPHLATAHAPSRQGVGSRNKRHTGSRSKRVR